MRNLGVQSLGRGTEVEDIESEKSANLRKSLENQFYKVKAPTEKTEQNTVAPIDIIDPTHEMRNSGKHSLKFLNAYAGYFLEAKAENSQVIFSIEEYRGFVWALMGFTDHQQ